MWPWYLRIMVTNCMQCQIWKIALGRTYESEMYWQVQCAEVLTTIYWEEKKGAEGHRNQCHVTVVSSWLQFVLLLTHFRKTYPKDTEYWKGVKGKVGVRGQWEVILADCNSSFLEFLYLSYSILFRGPLKIKLSAPTPYWKPLAMLRLSEMTTLLVL